MNDERRIQIAKTPTGMWRWRIVDAAGAELYEQEMLYMRRKNAISDAQRTLATWSDFMWTDVEGTPDV